MGCKSWLKLLGGLALMYSSFATYGIVKPLDPWFILGLMFFLMGVAKFVCKCECCASCETGGKKKK
ncbi:MAG: hypothetical protein N3E51_04410 [Candidatus Micrarchaeota archaeon]|nr:hypothetical protein [Candidatus Micrarchaeota archaeon]